MPPCGLDLDLSDNLGGAYFVVVSTLKRSERTPATASGFCAIICFFLSSPSLMPNLCKVLSRVSQACVLFFSDLLSLMSSTPGSRVKFFLVLLIKVG